MFVDSSFLVGLGRGHDAAEQFYEDHAYEEFSTSTIVAYELFYGLAERNRTALITELRQDLDWVDFVPFDVSDAAETAVLESELEASGERLHVADVMIAAAARRRNELLVGADGHFDRIDGLDYLNFRNAVD